MSRRKNRPGCESSLQHPAHLTEHSPERSGKGIHRRRACFVLLCGLFADIPVFSARFPVSQSQKGDFNRMTVEYSALEDGGCLSFSGELDHHAAAAAIRRSNSLLDEYQPGSLMLDMSGLSFMDSSGLALLMGLRRRMGYVGGALRVENVPRQAYRVLVSAGMDKLMKISKKED